MSEKDKLNGELVEIGADTDEILEDTEDIQSTTKAIDRKIWLLVFLWILDKIIIGAMLYID